MLPPCFRSRRAQVCGKGPEHRAWIDPTGDGECRKLSYWRRDLLLLRPPRGARVPRGIVRTSVGEAGVKAAMDGTMAGIAGRDLICATMTTRIGTTVRPGTGLASSCAAVTRNCESCAAIGSRRR